METKITQESEKSSLTAERLRAFCTHCKGASSAFISTFGLLFVIVVYSLAGAFLFKHLEEPPEFDKIYYSRVLSDDIKQDYAKRIQNLTESMDGMQTTDLEKIVTEIMQAAFNITVNNKWDGLPHGDNDTIRPTWNFPGALLYAVSAITTIGYGHVSPKTTTGQMLTILYCLIGLPITIMYVAKLGKVFAQAFRVIYHTCCCGMCCLSCIIFKKRKQKKRAEKAQAGHLLEALVIDVEGQAKKPKTIVIGGKRYKKYSAAQIWWRFVRGKFAHSNDDTTTVPIYICFFVMLVYIVGGAFIFSIWEDTWSPLEGGYFCFITLTTIGFGDYVPGVAVNSIQDLESTQKLIICAVYVFIGLAFIGMCIDLMQADVVAKVRWLGDHIGLTNKSRKRKTTSEKHKAKVGAKLSNACESGSTSSLNDLTSDLKKNGNFSQIRKTQSARHVPSYTTHTVPPSYARANSYQPPFRGMTQSLDIPTYDFNTIGLELKNNSHNWLGTPNSENNSDKSSEKGSWRSTGRSSVKSTEKPLTMNIDEIQTTT